MLYILGSGFSVPAGGPLLTNGVKALFDDTSDPQATWVYSWVCEHLYKQNPFWEQSVSLEEIISRLDLFIHYRLLPRQELQSSSQVKDWLLKKFLETLTPQRLHACQIYKAFAQRLSQEDIIISFNYDLVLEDSLIQANVPFHYPINSCERSLPVLKLHGSINYWQCDSCNNLLISRQKGKCALHPAAELNQLIIPPTLYKNYSSFALRSLWSKALAAALQSQQFCIIGYSCSVADCLSIQLLDYALALGKCRQITLVNGSRYNPQVFSEMGYDHLVNNTGLSFSEYISTLGSLRVTH